MNLIHDKKELKSLLRERKKKDSIVGYVPTMGALHEGHLSLVKRAVADCDLVVVSIFVNPTQFDNASDLAHYPRTLEGDMALLKEHFTDLIIFAPDVHEVYGDHSQSETFDFGPLAKRMEGASRDGHFDGVGTILKKFFTWVSPNRAYFGEKDYQQLLIVKKLVQLLELPIEIVGCPISREESGLARSSRNIRLTAKEQEKATFIHKSLLKAKKYFNLKSANDIIAEIESDFKNNPDFDLDYFEIADAESLEGVSSFEENKKYRAFVAARIGEVRLIDNMALN